MNKLSRIGLSVIVASFLLVGCGGGGGSSVPSTSSNQANGAGNKGPFKKGSFIVARQLDASGNYIQGKESNTTTIDDKGSYTLNPGWTGPTEVRIIGEYLNEATGTYMSDGNISAVINISGSTSAGINIFTDMAASIIREKMAENQAQNLGKSFDDIKKEAQEIVQKQFNLNLGNAKLEDLDMTSTKNEANAQLLKVSAALMKTPDPKTALQNLVEDIKDGEVDDAGLGAMQDIQEQAKDIVLEEIANNIENNVEGADAPDKDILGTLSLDSNITFENINDALPDTEYTQESVVSGVIGDSADISITGGTFTVNGVSSNKVSNGDLVTVKVTSSSEYNQTKTAKITIGGTIFDFEVKTKEAVRAKDITPDDFDLGYKSNVAVNSTNIVSKEVTINGIDDDTPISISNGEFSIDGGAYTSSATTINDGQKVKVRLNASSNYATATKAILTVGSVSEKFVVVTELEDKNPDPKSFSEKYDVDRNETVTSNTITVTGINTNLPIKIINGKYIKNGGSPTDAPSTVAKDDTIQVQLIASQEYKTTKTAQLYIGDMVVPFKVTTKENPIVPDTVPNPFKFEKVYTDDQYVEVNSSTITISGINQETPISIKGGEYSINGGSYTSDKGVVSNEDNVTVRLESAKYGESAFAVLTVGGVSSTFKVVTRDDKIPDIIDLGFKDDQNLSTEVSSNEVTISGLSHPVSISLSENASEGLAATATPPTFTVNGATATEVKNGDKVVVKLTTSDKYSTITAVKLNIGESSFVFAAKTKAAAPTFEETTKTIEVDEDTLFKYTPKLTQGVVESWDVNKSSLPAWLKFDDRVGTFFGTPANEDVGEYNISVTATNASGSNEQNLTIKVNNVNDAPVLEDLIGEITLDENNNTLEKVVELNATDVDVGDSLTFSVTPDSSPYVDINLSGTTLTFKLKEGVLGHTSKVLDVKVKVEDTSGASDEKTIKLTLVGKNNLPEMMAPPSMPSSVAEDSDPFTIKLSASDPDGDNITFNAVSSNPQIATVSVSGNVLTVTPQKDAFGDINITVTPFDGLGYGDPAIYTISITPVDDAPVMAQLAPITKDEDFAPFSVDLNATDIDSDNITYEIVSNISQNETPIVDANISGSTLNISSIENANGIAEITVRAYDGEKYSEPVKLDMIVNPINDAPVALPDTATTDSKHSVTVDVLANDIDVDGDALKLKDVNSSQASIVDNKLVFMPNEADANKTIVVGYTITDGKLDANGTLTIDVTEYISTMNTALDKLNDIDFESDDIEAKIEDIKTTLNNASSDDLDAQVGVALVELAQILNSDEVKNFVSVSITNPNANYSEYLPMFVDGIMNKNSSLKVEILSTATNLSDTTTDILHDFATKLKNISDKINAIYTQNPSHVFRYDGEEIDKNKAKMISSLALVAASNLEFVAAHYFMNDEYIKPKTETINGSEVEYSILSSDPVTVFNDPSTFSLADNTRLANAKTLLLEAIDNIMDINVSSINDSQLQEDINDTQSKLPDIKDSLNGNSLYVISDDNSSDSDDENVTVYLDLAAFFDPATALSLSTTLGNDFDYDGVYDLTQSKLHDKPVDANGTELDFDQKSYLTAAESHIDDIIVKVDANGTIYTDDDLLNYLNDEMDIQVDYNSTGVYLKVDGGYAPYTWTLVRGTDGILLESDFDRARINPNGVTGDIWFEVKVTDKYGHTEYRGGSFYIDPSSNGGDSTGDDDNVTTPPDSPNSGGDGLETPPSF